jgi:hypothetical protein
MSKDKQAIDGIKPTNRSSLGIRTVLFEELDMLRRGESSPSRANAVAKTAGQIMSTVKLELDYMRFTASIGEKGKEAVDGKSRVLQLGE